MRIIGNDPNTPRQTQVVASGTLSTGNTVVVNSDGTVSVVAGSTKNEEFGSPSVFESAAVSYVDSTFDSTSNKFIIAYQDSGNSQKGTAVVGTVNASDNSISFGTPVIFQNSGVEYCSVVHDSSNDKIVIFYHDFGDTNYGKAIVGTVSGTSISFGTAVVFASVVARTNMAVFDSGNGKVVNVYRNSSTNSSGDAVVGTVSGTSISFGSTSNWTGQNNGVSATSYIGSSKVFIAFKKGSDSDKGYALIATVSGTSLSYGSEYKFTDDNMTDPFTSYDSTADKVLVGWRNNSDEGKVVVATVSGTAITYGSAVNYASIVSSGDTSRTSATYDSVNDKTVIFYQDNGNSLYGTAAVGTISGTSISFGTPIVFEAASTNYTTSAFDSNAEKIVVGYRDQGNSNYGTGIVFQNYNLTTNLTAENYIGTAKSGAADGDGVVVNTQGTVQTLSFDTFDMSSTTYDNKSFNVGSQEIYPNGLAFKSDGTKMYVTGPQGNDVNEYALSTAWDVSTASYTTVFSTSGQTGSPQDIFFKTDGTKMYVLDTVTQGVFQYSLSTAWDISTASYDNVSFGTSGQDTAPRGMYIKPDGTKLYIVGHTNDAVSEYNLSSAWDMSTASYSQNYSISSEEGIALGLGFSYDGTKFFVVGNTNDTVYQYSLSTAWDVSTASYSSKSFSIAGQDTQAYSIRFKPDGTKMYIGGADNTSVFQYTTQGSLTPAQSYYVQTDGTLGTTAGSPSVFAGTAVSTTKLIVKG